MRWCATKASPPRDTSLSGSTKGTTEGHTHTHTNVMSGSVDRVLPPCTTSDSARECTGITPKDVPRMTLRQLIPDHRLVRTTKQCCTIVRSNSEYNQPCERLRQAGWTPPFLRSRVQLWLVCRHLPTPRQHKTKPKPCHHNTYNLPTYNP